MRDRRSFLKDMLARTYNLNSNRRVLGKTGEEINLVSLGGEITVANLDKQEEAVKIINRAIDLGVNYIDTAPAYKDGDSESNIGKVMKNRREEVFLASKTHKRSYSETMELIESSLNRLQTDYLDLYQVHNIRTEQDLLEIFSENGAIKALEELKDQDVIRNIGITGHKDPEILLKGIKEYDFDTALISMNAADIYYKSFQEVLLEKLIERNIGIIGMKVLGRGKLVSENGLDSIREALYYVWSLPLTTTIIGIGSLEELEENVELARKFEILSVDEMLEIEAKIEEFEEKGNFFKYDW